MPISDTTRTVYRVSDFVSWQKAGTLNLSPSFQRRPVWKPGAKSYLIDTVLRGLPVPVIFLRELPADLERLEPTREVVDGQQRLRTILGYIDRALLPDFDAKRDEFVIKASHNRDLRNHRFDQLPTNLRQKILDYQFSVHVFPSDVDDRDILQIFARLNATGVKLNQQELRNADYFGEFKTTMYELAAEQLPRWRSWQIFSEDEIARMQEVELMSEFAILALDGLTAKSQKKIDDIYERFEEEFSLKDQIERRIHITFDTIDDYLAVDLAERLPPDS